MSEWEWVVERPPDPNWKPDPYWARPPRMTRGAQLLAQLFAAHLLNSRQAERDRLELGERVALCWAVWAL